MNDILMIIALGLVFAVNGQELPSPDEVNSEIGSNDESNERIIGGVIAANHSRPWMIYVTSEKTRCGAVLIDPNWVLTAAHCVQKAYEPYTVVAGTNQVCIKTVNETIPFFGEGSEIRNVTKVYTDSYSNITFHNDIALLKVDRPFPTNDNIKPIPFSNKTYKAPDLLEVSGWGAIRIGSVEFVCLLRTVQLPVVTKERCLRVHTPIFDTEICAGYSDGRKGICDGDSGGPLVDLSEGSATLVGILSTGTTDCDSFSLYSLVQPYSSWIHETMKNATSA